MFEWGIWNKENTSLNTGSKFNKFIIPYMNQYESISSRKIWISTPMINLSGLLREAGVLGWRVGQLRDVIQFLWRDIKSIDLSQSETEYSLDGPWTWLNTYFVKFIFKSFLGLFEASFTIGLNWSEFFQGLYNTLAISL